MHLAGSGQAVRSVRPDLFLCGPLVHPRSNRVSAYPEMGHVQVLVRHVRHADLWTALWVEEVVLNAEDPDIEGSKLRGIATYLREDPRPLALTTTIVESRDRGERSTWLESQLLLALGEDRRTPLAESDFVQDLMSSFRAFIPGPNEWLFTPKHGAAMLVGERRAKTARVIEERPSPRDPACGVAVLRCSIGDIRVMQDFGYLSAAFVGLRTQRPLGSSTRRPAREPGPRTG